MPSTVLRAEGHRWLLKTAEVMDASGQRHKAVLTADDLAGYSRTIEAPQTFDYHDWTVAKTPAWGRASAAAVSGAAQRF